MSAAADGNATTVFSISPLGSDFRLLEKSRPAAGNPCGQAAGKQSIAGDIEVLDFEQNITSKLRISCIDTTNHIAYMTGPTEISQNNPGRNGFIAGNRYLVDNVEDYLYASQPVVF